MMKGIIFVDVKKVVEQCNVVILIPDKSDQIIGGTGDIIVVSQKPAIFTVCPGNAFQYAGYKTYVFLFI
jgi:hypothetical protein